jgi:GT2 family glycosyltransferase
MVGIIIVSFNHYLFTKMCVESIIDNTKEGTYKLCLVDNGSVDETKKWAKKLLSKGTLSNFISNKKNFGACKASNQGMKWAMGDKELTHVLVMANDHIVSNNWLSYMLESDFDCVNPFVFHSVKEIRAMAPFIGSKIEKYKELRLKYLQEDDINLMNYVISNIYSGGINSFSKKFRSKISKKFVKTKFILWPGLILYKKKVIEKTGLKDEDFLKYDLASYSDIDYYVRVYKNGFTSGVALNSYVHHWGSITTRKLGLKQEKKIGYRNNEHMAYRYFIKKWGFSPHDLRRVK